MKAIIEIPKGSKYKYEVDKVTGRLVLDRVISLPLPANYGYIDETLSEDGDPMDIFVISENPIQSLSEVKVQIFGIVKCVDSGVNDEKLVATIEGDDYLSENNYFKLMVEIKDYLETYKPGKIKIESLEDTTEAMRLLAEAKTRYSLAHPKSS